MVRRTALIGFFILFAFAAHAECPRSGARPVVLKSVTDSGTFLTAEGAEVVLAGVIARGAGAERITRTEITANRNALSQALANGPLTLAFAGPEKDRYGRAMAQVFAGGQWAQGILLRDGLVRVNPDPSSAACAVELLAAEAYARAASRGHWGDGSFAVLAPDDLAHKTGTFQIVEGMVRSVAVRKSRAYLNFGDDWRNDFTVTIAPEDMKAFRHARIKPKALEGTRVRVRGWIESFHGPEIELAEPAALENLEPVPPPKAKRKRKRPGSEAAGPPSSND